MYTIETREPGGRKWVFRYNIADKFQAMFYFKVINVGRGYEKRIQFQGKTLIKVTGKGEQINETG